jgi:hypothetical protein
LDLIFESFIEICYIYFQSKLANQSNEPEKTMEVCTVCGALLVVGDVQQRIDEHLMGKQLVDHHCLRYAFHKIC